MVIKKTYTEVFREWAANQNRVDVQIDESE